MLRVTLCAAFGLATVSASRPSFQTGQAMGEAISAGVSSDPDAFAAEMGSAFPKPNTNPNVDAVIAAQNKKYSFLARPALNLHVGETKSSTLAAESVQIRQKLAALEQAELSFADALSRSSFLQGPLSDIQREGASGSSMKDIVGYYASEINAGGLSARRGLTGLLAVGALPNGRAALNLARPLLIRSAAQLAKKESTSDDTRELAGSLITLISGLPFSVQSSDVATGSYGHTTIVLPAPSRVYGPDSMA